MRIATGIDLLADDPAARREASAQGLRNAATFDVARTADRVALGACGLRGRACRSHGSCWCWASRRRRRWC
ncbi:hypothetical protein Q5530_07045 [Saccharothrix sp. BKS2]|uniref:hypothetical protein n=1 Tax=Saccharothrix sp. BKS2 TaxID=3064400 RepID=UPI0039EBEFAD